ncbi:alpha/beta hydrolase [Flavobacterium cyanobacteriorum]|uniref:Alpha/beta hydrolase n=1 Tax=Flavobacterium cyanobacteriorum TaxID=2022802 RepID=A0A255ZBP7_9FLAO|nr:alpha/beta hydrolase [Flavobacterium cyanobacteriorum]OYQ38030.1 alpha/beta hydrolase [Flavobacterium cyanobacteriorum]
MEKIPVYFVPGLASSPLIFEYIKLPVERFEIHIIEWIMPGKNEPLRSYCKRLLGTVKHENPVLIGVSMGGLVVQEMKKLIAPRKVIIISSVKSNKQFPRRMWLARRTRMYTIFPTRIMQHVDKVSGLFPGNNFIKRRLKLYEKFLGVRDKKYLDWSFKTVINWDRAKPDPEVIHIHGTDDCVFPVKYIDTPYIPVPGGTHIMIINRFSWFNEHLPKIITGEENQID